MGCEVLKLTDQKTPPHPVLDWRLRSGLGVVARISPSVAGSPAPLERPSLEGDACLPFPRQEMGTKKRGRVAEATASTALGQYETKREIRAGCAPRPGR